MSGNEARGRAYARAALLGNPSDGYGGKTIGLVVREWHAWSVVRAADGVSIDPSPEDRHAFASLGDLAADVDRNGYYGGRRLVKAAAKRFATVCRARGVGLDRGFAIGYGTSIPRQVGLGGSSAIVIAALRALSRFHDVELTATELARVALATETEELGIPAGLQDRVIQAHEGLLYMDFAEGAPEPVARLDPHLLPQLFLAYRRDASEPSALVHGDIRARFERGEPEVVDAMAAIARLAERGRSAIASGDRSELGRLMAENVALRARIVELDPRHRSMVELAAEHGAPANYTGSGGAIVGIAPDGEGARRSLRLALTGAGCEVLMPLATGDPAQRGGAASGAARRAGRVR